MDSIESLTGNLFGGLWGRLSDSQFKESVELFRKRALANGFDLEWIKGKNCLDAGCGSGRYSVAMAAHGASNVTAIDISDSGLQDAARRCSDYSNIEFQKCSILDLPFQDESFDFVWSAGVIHHTTDFDKALSEISRVTKKGGKMFLLIYGAGGLRWKAIKSLRPIVADLGQEFISNAIFKLGLPENNHKHFMDDLFVPIQVLTRQRDIVDKIHALGFSSIDIWRGTTFDHEQSPDDQLNDIIKLDGIMKTALSSASSLEQKNLTLIGSEISATYVANCRRIITDDSLSVDDKKLLVIGEGNHRILSSK